jgi:hypothetical protein
MHKDLCDPKVRQSLTKPDGIAQLCWISTVSLYVTVTYPVKQVAIPTAGDYSGTPPRQMLRVKDRQEVDVISNASKIEDGHSKKRGEGQLVPLPLMYPLLLKIARDLR